MCANVDQNNAWINYISTFDFSFQNWGPFYTALWASLRPTSRHLNRGTNTPVVTFQESNNSANVLSRHRGPFTTSPMLPFESEAVPRMGQVYRMENIFSTVDWARQYLQSVDNRSLGIPQSPLQHSINVSNTDSDDESEPPDLVLIPERYYNNLNNLGNLGWFR